MRFNLALITTALLGMTLASPTECGSDLKVREDQSANNTADALTVDGVPLSPDSRSHCVKDCAEVLAAAGCIIAAIATDDPVVLRLCIKAADFSELCNCADCIPGLNDFLNNHGLCNQ